MSDEDVTHVTRNRRTVPPELKLVIDLVASVAVMYYATHPDCLDGAREVVARRWQRIVHRVSVWAATQDIRSLPETED